MYWKKHHPQTIIQSSIQYWWWEIVFFLWEYEMNYSPNELIFQAGGISDHLPRCFFGNTSSLHIKIFHVGWWHGRAILMPGWHLCFEPRFFDNVIAKIGVAKSSTAFSERHVTSVRWHISQNRHHMFGVCLAKNKLKKTICYVEIVFFGGRSSKIGHRTCQIWLNFAHLPP